MWAGMGRRTPTRITQNGSIFRFFLVGFLFPLHFNAAHLPISAQRGCRRWQRGEGGGGEGRKKRSPPSSCRSPQPHLPQRKRPKTAKRKKKKADTPREGSAHLQPQCPPLNRYRLSHRDTTRGCSKAALGDGHPPPTRCPSYNGVSPPPQFLLAAVLLSAPELHGEVTAAGGGSGGEGARASSGTFAEPAGGGGEV